MKHLLPRILLSLSGVILLLVGSAILFFPQAMYSSNGVTLGDEPNLLSEIRAPGGMLIGSALVMLLGVIRQNLTRQALILAALLYGSYGVSRLLSMLFDGVPSTSLVWAALLELIIGALCVVSILRFSQSQEVNTSSS
jgi:hypothetical protein